MKRWIIWLAGIGAVTLLSLFLVLRSFDWNLARPSIERWVSRTTGRSFEIKGDLNVQLSLSPRITVNDVVMGNAGWSKKPVMARIKRADFTISLPKLLVGRLSFPEISLSDGHLALEVNKDGTPNWAFGTSGRSWAFPHIGSLSIDNGTLTVRNPKSSTDLSFVVKTSSAAKSAPDAQVEVKGKGTFRGMAARLYASGGALLSLRRADRPYPVKAVLTIGRTRASISGTLLDPLHLKNEKVNFILEGADLAQLYFITGVPFPPTPPYKLTGHLVRTRGVWTFKQLEGKVGKSDLSGNFSVDVGIVPQMITADLESRNLDMKDLSGFIGAEDVIGPRNRVLPTTPFNLEKIRAADVDVRFKGGKIVSAWLPIDKMDTRLVIQDGTIKLKPLNFETAGGRLLTEITMDGRGPHIATHADITVRGLHLDLLLPPAKRNVPTPGVVGGRAVLDATGDSVSQMMGTSNGEVSLIMDGGAISELLLRKANVDLANSFLVLVRGDKDVPIRCMVANFKAAAGDFTVQNLVLDTHKVNITGDGHVNFADELLDLRLVSRSKTFSLVSLRGPILVTGPFVRPKVRPDTKKVVTRGAVAVGLGVATVGAAALIPLLDFGDRRDSNCAALMDQAGQYTGVGQPESAPQRK